MDDHVGNFRSVFTLFSRQVWRIDLLAKQLCGVLFSKKQLLYVSLKTTLVLGVAIFLVNSCVASVTNCTWIRQYL
jgi:hypothetical protein